MSNKNYIEGRRKEYAVINEERAKGNIAFRTAGSHSFVDVISIDVIARVIKFIQCKSGEFSDVERNKLMFQYREMNNMFRCSFDVV